MREGRCISLIERLKQGSELKSTLSIGKLFQRFMTRSVKKLDLTELLQKYLKILSIQFEISNNGPIFDSVQFEMKKKFCIAPR